MLQTKQKNEDIKKVCKWIPVIDFDENAARIAAEIYRDMKRMNNLIEFRDIFIAATAISMKYALATFNTMHFKRIQNLDFYQSEPQ